MFFTIKLITSVTLGERTTIDVLLNKAKKFQTSNFHVITL